MQLNLKKLDHISLNHNNNGVKLKLIVGLVPSTVEWWCYHYRGQGYKFNEIWCMGAVVRLWWRARIVLVLQKVPSEANPKVRNHGEGPY